MSNEQRALLTLSLQLSAIISELGIETTEIADVIAEIRRLKKNQKLPDYSLGKYKNVCLHGRPLSDICPQCYSHPHGKFRE